MKRLLILDLDETLVFVTERHLGYDPDFAMRPYLVYKRPHLDGFLELVSPLYELAVWTSSGSDYAAELARRVRNSYNESRLESV